MNIPRLVLAGTHSGSGKTTLTLGLLAALKRNGYRVQPFKVGPDYIDPGLHRAAAGVDSHNLDAWMGNEEAVRDLFLRYTGNCDAAVVEGVMGLFDGVKNSETGSTAHVSRVLEAPVVLVVNARGMARSCGALLKGYKEFDPRVNVAGVIFNNVGGPNHVNILKEVAENEAGVKMLGALKRRENLSIPERHLGLLPAAEHGKLDEIMEELAAAVEEDVDLERVLEIARRGEDLGKEPGIVHSAKKYDVTLAVARDDAFNFYYPDSLNYLEELGAELVYFSPLYDESLPRGIQGIYIGGGFPEMFFPTLAANTSMMAGVKGAYQDNIPVYAECGGLMYLAGEVVDFNEESYRGVGLVPGQVVMQKKAEALGYVEATARQKTLLTCPGERLRGHEFHYSKLFNIPGERAAYALYGGKGENGRIEGYVYENLLASYVHLHFRYNPGAAERFMQVCSGGFYCE